MMPTKTAFLLAALALLVPAIAWASPESSRIADAGCATLSARVDAEAGSGPVFLRSFDSATGKGPADNVALAGAAFTYDNALAAIALTACGNLTQAKRIGAALALAATHDRSGVHGRIRNAYRSGPQANPPPPNGWWDAAAGRWLEDDYQVGVTTGNVAWAALALLTLSDATGERRFLDAATLLMTWVVEQTADSRGDGGFTGGIFGGEAEPRKLAWKSTEHNADLDAAFRWLARKGVSGRWSEHAATARAFLAMQWDAKTGRFQIGTLPDGVTSNRATSGLDAQLWPLLLPDAPPDWRSAVKYAERAHGVDGGFSFNDDLSGFWTEGTAQAALVYRVLNQNEKADILFGELSKMASGGGYLWATREDRITTGLAIGPDSKTADFFYYHLPHLGATAWGVIAAKGWNPFGPGPRR